MKSRVIKISLAVIIGVVCIGLYIKQVDNWDQVWNAMSDIHLGWVLAAVLINILSIYIRAIRWQAFLGQPRVSVWKLFLIANIGFMGNGVLPARMGELIRPLLVWRTTEHKFPTALATIVVERVYDLLGLLVILVFVLYVFPFPTTPIESMGPEYSMQQSQPALTEPVPDTEIPSSYADNNPLEWIKKYAKYGAVLFVILFVALGTMTFAPVWSLRVAEKIFSPLPKSVSSKLLQAVQSFEQGAATFRKPGEFVYCLFWTFLLWAIIAYSELAVLYAFGLDAFSFSGALILMVGICFAVMFPQLPGYIGVYQFAVLTILTQIFYVDSSVAGAAAIIMWFSQIPPIILLGFICLLVMGFSFKDISKVEEEIPEEELQTDLPS